MQKQYFKCGQPVFSKLLIKFKGHTSRCSKCHTAYVKAWRIKNYEKFSLQVAKRNQEIKKIVLTRYSNGKLSCSCCGENHLQFLTIEHINGDGGRHRKELKRGGVNFYKWLLAKSENGVLPEGYEVLCFNCNFALGHWGKCPHGKIANYAGRSKFASSLFSSSPTGALLGP